MAKVQMYKIDVKMNFNYFNFNVIHGGIDYEAKLKKKKKKIIPWANANFSRLPTRVYWKKDEKKLIDCIMRRSSFKIAVSTKRSQHLSNVCFFESKSLSQLEKLSVFHAQKLQHNLQYVSNILTPKEKISPQQHQKH